MTADKDALRKRLRTYALNASFSVAKDLNDAADALRMRAERDAVQIENESLTRQIDHVIDSANKCETAERQLAECQKECEEQARLNGMGSEREARLMAQLSELKAKHERLVARLREPSAWMNPENGVVVSAQQKMQIGEGSGYPKFSVPLYAMSTVALRDSEGGE